MRTRIKSLIAGTSDMNCGDGPLPCAGRIEPFLRYRVEGEVAAGFAIRTPDGTLSEGFRSRWIIDRDFLLGVRR